jgi:hypothetical protein
VTPGTNYWDYGKATAIATGSAQYIAANQASQAIVNAWINNPFSANFFNSYALSPPINPTIAKTTGNLRDGFIDGVNDANGPNEGGGSNFGDHQTTVDNLSKGLRGRALGAADPQLEHHGELLACECDAHEHRSRHAGLRRPGHGVHERTWRPGSHVV